MVQIGERFHRFQFHYNDPFDNQVEPVSPMNCYPLVFRVHAHLSVKTDLAQAELMTETGLVGRLKKPGSNVTMNFNRRPNNNL